MKNIKLKSIIILFLLFFVLDLSSQVYIPKNKQLILDDLEKRYDNSVAEFSGNYKSKVKKEFKKRKEYIEETLLDSVFVFDDKYDTYLEGILKNIKKGNPNLNLTNYFFLFNRDPSPNASCFGNGFFMLNLGLFNFLKSEDELVFIICHEIAHQKLNHVNESIKKRIYKANSKEIKKKIRASKASVYGRSKAARLLLKELSYGMFKNSRKSEFEADSLGYEIYKNTTYSLSATANSLESIKRIEDKGVFKTEIKIDSLLSFNEYPFKKYWLDDDEAMFGLQERIDDYEWDKDSLKTHPDIEERILKLKSLDIIDNTKTIGFDDVKSYVENQQIKSLLYFGNIDVALYILLEDLQEDNENDFTVIKLIESFKEIYKLKNKHQLGKKIPQSSPFTKEKNLNSLRVFIHNLEIKETRKIGYQLCLKYDKLYGVDEDFRELKNYFEKLNN